MKTSSSWGHSVTRVSMWFLVALLSFSFLQMLVNAHAVIAGSDTYPAPWAPPTRQDSMFDTWREYNRECTSYAAWMLHSTSGFEMPFFADAINWGTKASALGYTVNMSPAVGSVYWSTSHDHVAWVESVSSDGKTITTQDYNSGYPNNPGWYGEHFGVSASSASGYIHFKDFIVSPPPPPPPPPLRVGVVTGGSGSFLVKEGSTSNNWVTEASGGITTGLISNRLIATVGGGQFYVKQGTLDQPWVNEYSSGAVAGSISDASGSNPLRIGVLNSSGHFLVKENTLDANWTDETPGGGATSGYVSGSRIGVVLNDGTFLVKDGGLTATWVTEGTGISQGVLSGNLIGEITTSGTFYVKSGAIDASWSDQYDGGVTAGYLSDATSNTPIRIGFLDSSGTFRVKEGGLTASWAVLGTGITQGVISGGLVGELYPNGTFNVKQGSSSANWTDLYDGATSSSLWSL